MVCCGFVTDRTLAGVGMHCRVNFYTGIATWKIEKRNGSVRRTEIGCDVDHERRLAIATVCPVVEERLGGYQRPVEQNFCPSLY